MNASKVFGGMVVVTVMVLAICGSYVAGRMNIGGSRGEIVFNSNPVVTEIREIAEFAALEVRIADIVEGHGNETWWRWVKGAWIIKGDARIGVDIAQADIAVDQNSKTVRLQLPAPSVMYARVDHAQTKTYDVKRGWLAGAARESDMRDDAMLRAQKAAEHAANKPQHIEAARQRLEQLVRKSCARLGWTVNFVWQDAMQGPAGSNVVCNVPQTTTAMK
jgi:hypothetical protein